MASIAEIAAAIHADMCNDERNGYSWEERWGQAGNPKYLTIDGRQYAYNLGDYDCSSSVITAYRQAVRYTPFDGCFDAAQSTHSMYNVFMNSGLFDNWNTNTTNAARGDVYLNDQNHTAICQSPANPDTLSEFSWGDVGAYGNQRGDQSGWESHITNFYNYPWSRTLHYNGSADGTQGDTPNVVVPTPSKPVDSGQVKYCAYVGGAWLDPMVGRVDTGQSDDNYAGILGRPILYLAVEGVGKYRVCTEANGWLPWVEAYNLGDFENGCAGDGSAIIAVEIPNSGVRYAAHNMGADWNSAMIGNTDTGGSSDTFAGSMVPIDGLWIERV